VTGGLSEVCEIVEFGRVNPSLLGRKAQYAFLSLLKPEGGVLIQGVAKVTKRSFFFFFFSFFHFFVSVYWNCFALY
jgi:hypothetical protein